MAPLFPSKYMSTSEEYPIHIHGWLRIHKNGQCERFVGNDIVPAGTDPSTCVQSKDVVISQDSNVFVRLYIPKPIILNTKLPILIYFHGGGFITESVVSSMYQPTLNLITTQSNVIVVSVNYRLAPEYPIPTAYEDSWKAIMWVAYHARGNGTDSWLNNHADFQNMFFGGDSAGANIAHHMAIRVGLSLDNTLQFINLKGLILLNPYFSGKDQTEDETSESHQFMDHLWKLANPYSKSGLDDKFLNPSMDSNIRRLGCNKIFVCVCEKDKLRARGLNYKKVMEKSGWKGKIEVMEIKGEGHVFFLSNTLNANACLLRNRICTFINPIRSKV